MSPTLPQSSQHTDPLDLSLNSAAQSCPAENQEKQKEILSPAVPTLCQAAPSNCRRTWEALPAESAWHEGFTVTRDSTKFLGKFHTGLFKSK